MNISSDKFPYNKIGGFLRWCMELVQKLFPVLLITLLLLTLIETVFKGSVSSYLNLNDLLIIVIIMGIIGLIGAHSEAESKHTEQTTLRSVLGQSKLDELPTKGEMLNQRLTNIIDEHTDPWGVKVGTVEIKEVELAEQMKQMMAVQAEAESKQAERLTAKYLLITVSAGIGSAVIIWYKTQEIGWLSYVISIVGGGLIGLLPVLIWRESKGEKIEEDSSPSN